MKPIVINNWHKGIGASAFTGFQEIRGLNITDKPGVCYPNKSTAKDSGDVVLGLIGGFALQGLVESSNNVWAFDNEEDKVYKRTGQGTWAALTAHTDTAIYNIIYFKSKVAVILNAKIEFYNPSDNSCDTSWASNSITSGGTKPAVIALDGAMYIGSGNVVDKVPDLTEGNVVKATTSVPDFESIQEILTIGDYLYLVCDKKIYPWDVAQGSTFPDGPIHLNKRINQAIVYANMVYVQAGFKGEWFRIEGGSAIPFAKVPQTILEGGVVSVSRPCVHNELIFFGLYTSTIHGIYSLNPLNGALNLEYVTSTGNDDEMRVGPLFSLGSSGDQLLIPWQDYSGASSVYGIDRVSGNLYTGDKTFLISRFYSVGTLNHPRTFSNPTLKLSKALASGDSLKIYYRQTQNGDWTTHQTLDTVGQSSFNLLAFPDLVNFQVKITLNKASELLEVILQ